MECRDAQFYLRFRRLGSDDLGPEVSSSLDQHLAACPGCAIDSRATLSVDLAFATAMRDVPIPAGLRNRLVADLSARRGTVQRQRAYRVLAVAASLLLAVGVGFGIASATRPRFDVDRLAQAEEQTAANPRQAVRDWLRAQDLPGDLPLSFNYQLLVTFGTERVQGRDVPVVVFRAPPHAPVNGVGYAKLYILPEGDGFKLDQLGDAQNSHCQADVIADPVRFPGVRYVVLRTNALELFLNSGPTG